MWRQKKKKLVDWLEVSEQGLEWWDKSFFWGFIAVMFFTTKSIIEDNEKVCVVNSVEWLPLKHMYKTNSCQKMD